MVECLNARMLNESSSVSDDSTGCAANVRVDFEDFFDGFWDDESGLKSAFDCKHYSFCSFDADGGRAQLHVQVHTLMASMAYSTWKIRPSGEKVLMPRS